MMRPVGSSPTRGAKLFGGFCETCAFEDVQIVYVYVDESDQVNEHMQFIDFGSLIQELTELEE